MDKTKTKKIYTVLACLGLLFVLLSVVEFMPVIVQLLPFVIVLIPAFILAIPMVLTFAFVACGYTAGAIAGAAAFGAAALLGYAIVPYAAVAFIPLALACGYMITKARRFRTSFAATAFVALVGAVLVIVIITATTKMGVVEYAVKYIGEQLALFDDSQIPLVHSAMRYMDIISGAVTQEAINATGKADAIIKMQRIVKDFLNESIVYLMILYAMGLGYLGIIIPGAVAKQQGYSVADRHGFKDYTLPRRLWIVAVVFVIASMIGGSFGWQGFDILQTTVYSVFAFVFMIQGLSLMAYWLAERNTGKGIKAILMVGAVIVLQTTILPLLGLAENIFGIRKRMQARKAEKK